jgi:hypothetical protein
MTTTGESKPVPVMARVDSTSINAVGYDEATNELYVEFVGRDETYVYFAVAPRVHREFLAAESKGGYFNRRIRPQYAWRRL